MATNSVFSGDLINLANGDININASSYILPSKTYKIDFENKRIIGTIDGHEAVVQFCRKVLMTDKYADFIYDWYYGNEIYTLLGMPTDLAMAELPRVILEALAVDNRIVNISEWQFEIVSIDSIKCSFVVTSIFSSSKVELEVKV